MPITSTSYNADCDLDRNGVLNNTDLTLMGTSYVAALPAGDLSNATVKNTIGWDGYVFNAECGLYHVRYRWYSTELGRWVERDPAEYVDGMSLYEVARGRALIFLDPLGQDAGWARRRTPNDPWGEKCCEQRDYVVFDFGGFPLDSTNPINWADYYAHYPDSIYFPERAESVANYLDLISRDWDTSANAKAKCICFKRIIIAGHGSGPGAITLGGTALGTLQVIKLLEIGRTEAEGLYSGDLAFDIMLDLLDTLDKYLCPGGTLELLTCDAGADSESNNYGTRLRQALEQELPGRHIILSRGSCRFYLHDTKHDDGTNETPAD